VSRGIEGLARRYWRGEARPITHVTLTALTAPLAAAFGAAVRLRNRAFDTGLLRARSAPVPVISVGNLSVGGTGKTPITRWVVERLLARGRRPVVVSRGYGADELALHRRWHPEVRVIANPDRVVAAREAARTGGDVVVLDDGFQHRALARDADLLLLGAGDPFPPRLLPRGPYREPLSAIGRASLVLVTGRGQEPADDPEDVAAEVRRMPRHPPVGTVRLVPVGWRTLAGEPGSPPASDEALLIVASVADPASVLRLVDDARAGERVDGAPSRPESPLGATELVAFPDHHDYGASDVERILNAAKGRRIVTTEKDAVKLIAFPEHFAGALEPRVLALDVVPGVGVERLLDRLLDRALAHGSVPGGTVHGAARPAEEG
jgi:tetraacyldisaccharide 4'-kinase